MNHLSAEMFGGYAQLSFCFGRKLYMPLLDFALGAVWLGMYNVNIGYYDCEPSF